MFISLSGNMTVTVGARRTCARQAAAWTCWKNFSLLLSLQFRNYVLGYFQTLDPLSSSVKNRHRDGDEGMSVVRPTRRDGHRDGQEPVGRNIDSAWMIMTLFQDGNWTVSENASTKILDAHIIPYQRSATFINSGPHGKVCLFMWAISKKFFCPQGILGHNDAPIGRWSLTPLHP